MHHFSDCKILKKLLFPGSERESTLLGHHTSRYHDIPWKQAYTLVCMVSYNFSWLFLLQFYKRTFMSKNVFVAGQFNTKYFIKFTFNMYKMYTSFCGIQSVTSK